MAYKSNENINLFVYFQSLFPFGENAPRHQQAHRFKTEAPIWTVKISPQIQQELAPSLESFSITLAKKGRGGFLLYPGVFISVATSKPLVRHIVSDVKGKLELFLLHFLYFKLCNHRDSSTAHFIARVTTHSVNEPKFSFLLHCRLRKTFETPFIPVSQLSFSEMGIIPSHYKKGYF